MMDLDKRKAEWDKYRIAVAVASAMWKDPVLDFTRPGRALVDKQHAKLWAAQAEMLDIPKSC